MNFSPIVSAGFFDGVSHQAGELYISKFKDGESGGEIDLVFKIKPESKKLIVVFPSAISRDASDTRPIFHRWSWAEEFDSNFICLSDPSFDILDLLGGWFLVNGERDLFKELKNIIINFAEMYDIEERNITFYGSSMGGFGALMLSSFFPKSLSVAEVPQIDLRHYPWKSAIRAIEEKCLSGKSINEFYEQFPERVSVIDRFKDNGVFSNIEIISNAHDIEVSSISSFYEFYLKNSNVFSYVGNFGITITNKVSGHRPLPKNIAVRMLKFLMRKHQII